MSHSSKKPTPFSASVQWLTATMANIAHFGLAFKVARDFRIIPDPGGKNVSTLGDLCDLLYQSAGHSVWQLVLAAYLSPAITFLVIVWVWESIRLYRELRNVVRAYRNRRR